MAWQTMDDPQEGGADGDWDAADSQAVEPWDEPAMALEPPEEDPGGEWIWDGCEEVSDPPEVDGCDSETEETQENWLEAHKSSLPQASIRQVILQSDLDQKEQVAAMVREALLLQRSPADAASQARFVSRLGGIPDLPAHIAWPRHHDVPLACVGQINLAELPEFDGRARLPSEGMLYFFYDSTREADGYDPKDEHFFAVIYTAPFDEPPPKMETLPADLDPEGVYVPARIRFARFETFPGITFGYSEFSRLGMVFSEEKKFFDLVEPYCDYENHQVFGWPSPIQQPVEMVCEKIFRQRNGQNSKDEDVLAGMHEWVLLLQIRSDEELGMYWPYDMGILYFMIRKDDLEAKRFDRAWMIKQYT